MDLNKLTIKSQQALQQAQEQAAARNHAQVEPAHLLLALLSDPEGVVYPLLQRVGQSPRALRDRVEELVARLPKVYGTQEVALSSGTRRVLERAFSEAAALTDEYVSTEHLFLALMEGATDVARLLAEAGLGRDRVLSALAEVRGRQRVTDQNPEEKYQALERYGRDLTELARRGEARSGHRPRRRDPPGDPGALAPHEEQPGADRRARRGQDGHRGGPGAADRGRRRARLAEGQAGRRARHRLAGRRLEVPRRVRGALQGGAEGDRRQRGRGRHVHRRAAHRGRRGRGRRGRWTPATC